MIIVSQDRTEIVNFNKILSVKLYHDNEDAECLYEIYTTVNAPGDNYILIGIYNTEQRAKEVLQEIERCYKETEKYKLEDGIGREAIAINNDAFVYKMPKE